VQKSWLALMIGNSRLHWAWFIDATLKAAWDMNHLQQAEVEPLIQHWASGIIPDAILPSQFIDREFEAFNPLPLYLASVVPAQTKLWQTYPATQLITLADVPLTGLYPTLGIDRALAVLGAGETFGYPVLAIDAGTALTFTGANAHHHLMGGAILPGLGLQLQSLSKNTAALPATSLPTQLPPRWALQTATAIESGVIYTVLAGIRDFIEDWHCQFPNSQIVLTGGDSHVLLTYFQAQFPQIARQLIANPHLIFWGIRSIFQRVTQKNYIGKARF
jgi:type III pantothenate kinase